MTHPYEISTKRGELLAAETNLAGLKETLGRTEFELDFARQKFGVLQAEKNRAGQRVFDLGERGAFVDYDGMGTSSPAKPSTAPLAQAIAEAHRIEDLQQPLQARMVHLEGLQTRITRAIDVETPRVEGLQAELAALEAPTVTDSGVPSGAPAEGAPLSDRLMQIGKRMAAWANP